MVFSQSSAPDANSLAYLKKFKGDYIKSMLDEKPEIIQSYFADDIRLMPEFQKTIKNKDNTSLYWKLFTDRFDTQELTRNEIEVLDIGTRIVEIGLFSIRMKLKSEDKYFELKGKYVDLWEKKDNKILLLTQAWNYDHAINFADQLQFKEVPSTTVAYEGHVPINNPISFELAALNQFVETVISARDSKIWSQFYADDAAWLYTGNTIVKGRKSLDDFFDQHAKELPIFEKLDIRNDRIDSSGIYTIEYASHIAIIRNGDFSGVFTGKDLVIWRREPNGSLKIFRHIGMYDQ
jgi:ketosteroid isomerase-like protein